MAKIITVNIPEAWMPAIEKLVGIDSLYPSRSELVRRAIEDNLTKYIEISKENIVNPKIILPAENEEDKLRRLVRESKEVHKIKELENQ